MAAPGCRLAVSSVAAGPPGLLASRVRASRHQELATIGVSGATFREDALVLGVDVGGTFTDVVAVTDGRITVTKIASDPSDPAAPVAAGARRLGLEGHAVFNHASTMGLNAVITRTLPKVAFLTTEG